MKHAKDIVKKVRSTISRHKMINRGDHVIAAVSGGPDSMCMLHILNVLSQESGFRLTTAHLEHGWRPREDKAETELVRRFSSDLGIPFESKTTIPETQGSLEETARKARYEFLEDVLEKRRGNKIATGHNMNDQAETLIIRLLRGSGVSGLAGIPPFRNNRIIRPMKDLERDDIERYLMHHDIPYAVDPSNQDKTFLRNGIRLELLPKMLDYEPNLIKRLGRLADILREEDDYMNQQAQSWVERSSTVGPDSKISILLDGFLKLPYPLKNRIVRQILYRINKGLRRIGYNHITAILKLAEGMKPQGALDLPNNINVEKIYDKLFFSLAGEIKEQLIFKYVIERAKKMYMKEIGKCLSLEVLDFLPDLKAENSANTAYVDDDRIVYPLEIRNFRPGDRFIPLGMKGHRKVKDFFMDLKIPSEERTRIPILLSESNIVWLGGYRLDERYKVTAESKRILKIEIADKPVGETGTTRTPPIYRDLTRG